MALRFYIRRVIALCDQHWFDLSSGVTNYHSLVDALDRWAKQRNEDILWVTFNYDTLLERALSDEAQVAYNAIDAYPARIRARLFKLHGSINWAYQRMKSPQPDAVTWAIQNAAEFRANPDEIVLRSDWSSGRNDQAWVPALAVPVRTKSQFQCPQAHLNMLSQHLPAVDRVLIIGWRGMEENFLQLLAERLRIELRAVLIACDDAREATASWNRVNQARGGLAMHSIRGPVAVDMNLAFSGLVTSPEFERFLAA